MSRVSNSTAPMPLQPLQPPPEPVTYRCDHPGCAACYAFGFSIPLGSPTRRFCAAHRAEGEKLSAGAQP